MRRAFVTGVLALVAMVASAVPAGAVTPAVGLAAHFTGTSVFAFDGTCSFAHQTFSARYDDGAGQAGRFLLDGCATIGSPNTYVGTFTLRPDGQPVVTGAVNGTIGDSAATCSGVAEDLDFTLAPTAGTPYRLHGLWCSPATPDVPGAIRGTIKQH